MFESEVTVVELFDATYCYEYSNYISLTLQALVSFVNLEMPHVNVRAVRPSCQSSCDLRCPRAGFEQDRLDEGVR